MNSNFQLILDPLTGRATFKGKLPAAHVENPAELDITALNEAIALINQRLEEIEMTLQNMGNGAGVWNWVTVTDPAITAAPNHCYILNSPDLITITLPVEAPIGATFKVFNQGQGQWKIAQLANQSITFGDKRSVTGIAGGINSTHDRDSIILVCLNTNSWVVESAVGNPNIIN